MGFPMMPPINFNIGGFPVAQDLSASASSEESKSSQATTLPETP